MDLFKAPGVAETHRLDARADRRSTRSRSTRQTVNDTLGALLKYQDDIARLQARKPRAILEDVKARVAA